MAHQRFKKITFNLSQSQISKAVNEISGVKADLQFKCDDLARRLAEQGLVLLRTKIFPDEHIPFKSSTGNLLNSIQVEQRGNGIWAIYTNCYYAQYVEYGTGIRGSRSPHPQGNGMYMQDPSHYVMKDGDPGWWYPKNGHWKFTHGLPSRPFMWDTREALRRKETIQRIAREVFG